MYIRVLCKGLFLATILQILFCFTKCFVVYF